MKISIEAVDLGKKFGEFWAIRGVSFNVKKESIGVLAGPNGAGKTTTVRILATFYKPSKGFARVEGFDVVRDHGEVRKRIAYMPQDYGFTGDITPYEFIVYNLMMRGFSYFEARQEAKYWIELLGLDRVSRSRIWVLSGGERRKVLVGSTLASGAEVVFLDEPTAGLDVESKYKVLSLVKEIAGKTGSTILLTTHMLEEAQLIADYVVFINNGVVITEGAPLDILARIPYRFRVILENTDLKCLGDKHYINLGGKTITWTRSLEEAEYIRENCRPLSYSIKDVSLEDVYLYIVGGGK
jgi:ABC-2 type transport system ATP-binding protein